MKYEVLGFVVNICIDIGKLEYVIREGICNTLKIIEKKTAEKCETRGY